MANGQSDHHLGVLDGWRAFSILCVLAAHLLPLGPKGWGLNGAVGTTGMVVFFNLSGFLIVRILLRDPDVPSFLVRRLFRVVPLAWLAVAVLAVASSASLVTVLANLGFVANLPPMYYLHGGPHLWSLSLEVQFYVSVALLVALTGQWGLYLLPVAGIAITVLRVVHHVPFSFVTWYRVDEILAGSTVAILHHRGLLSAWIPRRLALWAVAFVPLIVVSGHQMSGALNFLRPWLSATIMAMSLVGVPLVVDRVCRSRKVVYIANISYALFVIHGMLLVTWLNTGSTVVKYLKRPLLLAITFAFAHFSTYEFEARMTTVGRRLAARVRRTGTAAAAGKSAP